MVIPPEVHLLYRILLVILVFFCLFVNMKLNFVISRVVKIHVEILMGISLNLKIAIVKIAIFTMLILPRLMSMGNLSIFWYLLQFLSSKTWSSCHTDLSLRVIPRYFMLFVSVVKGVVFSYIICVWEDYWFFLVNLVSSHFIEGVCLPTVGVPW